MTIADREMNQHQTKHDRAVMRFAIFMATLALVAGCATVEAVFDALDQPEPVPCACPANAGATVNGKTCVQMSDGTWQWVSRMPGK